MTDLTTIITLLGCGFLMTFLRNYYRTQKHQRKLKREDLIIHDN